MAHHAVAECMRGAHKSAGMITHHHETANWFKGNHDLRPFDTIYKDDPTSIIWNVQDATIGDPSRIGKIRANQKYLPLGAAGQERVEYKMTKHRERVREHGPLTQAVDFNPVAFEAGGGFTKSANKWLDRVVKTKHENDDKKGTGKRKRSFVWSSWTAMSWRAEQVQKISWEINKCHALGALRGLKESRKKGLGLI